MAERYSPTPEDYKNADAEIAAAELERSTQHQLNVIGWPNFGIPGMSLEDAQHITEVTLEGGITTDLFLDNHLARTATLALVRLRGDRSLDKVVQAALVGSESRFMQPPFETHVYDRLDTQANDLRLQIDDSIVSAHGLTMLTRKRRLLATETFEQDIKHPATGKVMLGRFAIYIDKLSTAALNIHELEGTSKIAADEVREIIIASMIMGRNQKRLQHLAEITGDLRWEELDADQITRPFRPPTVEEERAEFDAIARAEQSMAKYGIPVDVVLRRIASRYPNRIRHPETIEVMEADIAGDTTINRLSTTTFFAERAVKGFSWHT